MNKIWTMILISATLYTVLAESSDLFDNSDLFDYSDLFEASPRRDLDFCDLVAYDGYECEWHTVTTEDGYVLGLGRVLPNKKCAQTNNHPILLNHGQALSGDDFLIPGPGKAHCYAYADNCSDVWAANARGNRYSRKHRTLDPDKDPEFWDFSFDEIGLKDTPTIIDYVLKTTQTSQLIYVGHSQAVATLLLLCAKKPEYNDKIKIGFGLSPTVWLDHSTFIVLPIEGLMAYFLAGTARNTTNVEILAHNGLTATAGKYLCGLGEVEYPLCSILLFALFNYNEFSIKPDVFLTCSIVGHTPAGTSLKNILRWGDVKNNGFTEVDLGAVENFKKYGVSVKPPEIDLSPVTMEWVFYTSYNDNVGTVKDVETLVGKLSNAKMYIVKTKYGHLDYLYASSLTKYITPNITCTIASGDASACNF